MVWCIAEVGTEIGSMIETMTGTDIQTAETVAVIAMRVIEVEIEAGTEMIGTGITTGIEIEETDLTERKLSLVTGNALILRYVHNDY